MIIHKKWMGKWHGILRVYEWPREGWFLFGFIPLYVRDVSIRTIP